MVDIDAASLREIGTWPWPRSLHGELLDRLLNMGAYEVAFDIDFSTRSDAAGDTAFAASLGRAGGYAFLSAFRQVGASAEEIWNRPIAEFGEAAQAALVNVDSLEAGMVWSLPGKNLDQDLRSIAAHFNRDKVVPDTLHIDFGINLDQIVRVSARSVLDGSVDPGLIRDRQIVVGASAIELHDLLVVPRFGIVPGPMVQIAAVETLQQDRSLADLSQWPAVGLSVLLILAGLLMPRLKFASAIGLSVAASVALETATMAIYVLAAVQIETSLFHATVAGVLLIRLLEERAVRRRQLQSQNARVAYLATHDDRTGAFSTSAWCQVVEALERDGDGTNILLIRLEQLDAAGATLGFAITDQVIDVFYQRLVSVTDKPIGRIENHVFALCVAEQFDEHDGERLLVPLETPFYVSGHRIVVHLRWGMSAAPTTDTASDRLQQARTAAAMASRRNIKGCRYRPEFEVELQQRRGFDIALRAAVEKNELDLAFQLQVAAQTRQGTGVEALLRWTSPDFGRVSPADFIPLAEENGTIVELGRWAAHEACRRAVQHGWTGRLSINVSPVQFTNSDVVAMVRSALERTGFPAERLDVEVTESLVAGGEASIVDALAALRKMGVSIAVDDFGTGYSSLSYLATLPIDKLKIDKSFVDQIIAPRGAEVAEAIVQLAKRLDLSVVVEGVETEEQFRFFSSLQCDTVQGFLFSRPASLAEATKGTGFAA